MKSQTVGARSRHDVSLGATTSYERAQPSLEDECDPTSTLQLGIVIWNCRQSHFDTFEVQDHLKGPPEFDSIIN